MVNLNLRRDFKINKTKKVLIVEDVITTGKSSLECSKLVKDFNKAIIVGYACIIDRSNGKSAIKKNYFSIRIKYSNLFRKDNLPDNLSSIKAIKPGSRNL